MTVRVSRHAVPALLLIVVGCRAPHTDPAPPMSEDPEVVVLDEAARRNAGLEIQTAQSIERADETEAPGRLAVDEGRTARIGSLVQGIVLDSSVQVGDRVTSGQTLATMHSPIVHEAWAQYRKAVADRRRLENELAFANQAHERAGRLYAAKAVALQEVQRADMNRMAAEELLDMARTEVRRSEEVLEHYGITNKEDPTGESGEEIPVRTPVRGVVLERLVTPGTTVTPGTPLFVVSDLSVLWALVEIDEALLSHIGARRSVDLRVAAYAGERFPGTVQFVSDVVSAKTRRVTVRCSVPNRDGRLKPEMFVTARVREGTPRTLVAVPPDAIQSIGGQAVVFIADTDSRFHARRVVTGADSEELVEVRSGLTAGERVVVRGSFVLKSAMLRAGAGKGN